jgi:hypothetical protein
VLGTEGLRARFESAGAVFRPYRYAPDNDLRRPETDLVKDWQTRNPLRLWVRVRDRLLVGPHASSAVMCSRNFGGTRPMSWSSTP